VPGALANESPTNSRDAVFEALLTTFEVQTDLNTMPPLLFDVEEN
jgi:hypothetical protein